MKQISFRIDDDKYSELLDLKGDDSWNDFIIASCFGSNNATTTVADNDSINDGAEINEYQTDPLDSDTDNDGMLDGDEIRFGFDPNDPMSNFLNRIVIPWTFLGSILLLLAAIQIRKKF